MALCCIFLQPTMSKVIHCLYALISDGKDNSLLRETSIVLFKFFNAITLKANPLYSLPHDTLHEFWGQPLVISFTEPESARVSSMLQVSSRFLEILGK